MKTSPYSVSRWKCCFWDFSLFLFFPKRMLLPVSCDKLIAFMEANHCKTSTPAFKSFPFIFLNILQLLKSVHSKTLDPRRAMKKHFYSSWAEINLACSSCCSVDSCCFFSFKHLHSLKGTFWPIVPWSFFVCLFVCFSLGKFQMQVLPQCGHAVHEDAPDRVGTSLSPQRSFFHPDDVNVPRDRKHQTCSRTSIYF